MRFPRSSPVTSTVVDEFIALHQRELPRYKYLMELYKGNHDILFSPPKNSYKPDNRLLVNFPKYIVDTFAGFFNGSPVKKTHPESELHDKIRRFDRLNDSPDEEYELAKLACVYGRAYEFMYQDEEGYTRVIYNSPENMFVVYDDSVSQLPLFAVVYGVDKNGDITGSLFTERSSYELAGQRGKLSILNEKENPYDGLPIYEWIHNDERMGIFESAISLINSLNKALSEKANDVDYFADAYLAVLGAELDDEGIYRIRDNRIINLYGTDDAAQITVKFLEKPNADSAQENFLDRTERFIYQSSMTANISDSEFGSSSGVALAYKLQPMSNLALTMQRKFQSSLSNRYRLFFSLGSNVNPADSQKWQDIEYSFTRNLPRNLLEESQIAQNLNGQVSNLTKLSAISLVDDPALEMERIAGEVYKMRT